MQEAVASYNKVIQIKPDYAEAYNNRGNALKDLWQLDEAVASYSKAIQIRPDFAEACSNRGIALQEQGLAPLSQQVCSFCCWLDEQQHCSTHESKICIWIVPDERISSARMILNTFITLLI